MAVCANCGAEPPDGARFCPSCGAALAEAREARKVVTVVFCDWVDSTPLGEGLDPESLRRIQETYFGKTRAVLERHGGTVEKFIGDAVMAVFGIPRAHEDDALRAVRAAVELREALSQLNERFEGAHGVRLSLRTGVNTGEVIAGDHSSGHSFVTGDAVVVAKRLEEQAAPSEILIGEKTRRLVRNAVLVEPVEALALKGKTEPVAVWRLLGVLSGAPAYERRLDSALVGRERELALLRQAFARAASEGTGHFFTVLGSAGVGKSRLVHELLTEVADEATVLLGRCLPYGKGITFWPLAECFRDAASIEPGLPYEEAHGRIVDLLAGDPEAEIIAGRICASIGLSDEPVPAQETFWAMRRVLESIARAQPVVVLFDDIHWGEELFLDLIEYVGEWTRDSPVLLLCLARPELLERRAGWGGGKLNATSILLEPLTESESHELIDQLAGDAGLSTSARLRITEAAEGNPLFVEQMVAMLAEKGGPDGELEIPPTIQALLAARLDRLDAQERGVIERAAVIGKRFWEAAVVGLSPGSDRLAVGPILQRLVRKELIRPERSVVPGEEGYRFRHLLIRDAAYSEIPKEVRAELHERFAVLIEEVAGERFVEVEELLGYHLEQAFRCRRELGPPDDHARKLAARAGTRLAAAGRRALARGDASAAANLLDRAGTLLADAPGRERLLTELGAALVLAGEFATADAVLTEAIEAAAGRDRRVELHALLERGFLRALTDPKHGIDELRRVAEAALSELEELGDDAGAAKAWRRIADVHWLMNQWGEQERALVHALEHAQRAGDARQAADAMMRLPMAIYFGPTPVPEAIGRAQAILDRADARAVQCTPLVCLAGLHAMSGLFDLARDLLARGRAIAEELGLRVWLAGFSLIAGEIEMLADDPVAAERELRRGYAAFEGMGDRGVLSRVAAELARALLAQDRLEEAESFTNVSEELAGSAHMASQISWRSVRAGILARRGELTTAEQLAREASGLAERTDDINSQGRVLMALAEVLETAARPGEAIPLLERALELFEQKENAVIAAKARTLLEARVESPT